MDSQQKEIERLKKVARAGAELYEQLRLYRDLIVWNTDEKNKIKLPESKDLTIAKLNLVIDKWEQS